jgi:hypothetical protein
VALPQFHHSKKRDDNSHTSFHELQPTLFLFTENLGRISLLLDHMTVLLFKFIMKNVGVLSRLLYCLVLVAEVALSVRAVLRHKCDGNMTGILDFENF